MPHLYKLAAIALLCLLALGGCKKGTSTTGSSSAETQQRVDPLEREGHKYTRFMTGKHIDFAVHDADCPHPRHPENWSKEKWREMLGR